MATVTEALESLGIGGWVLRGNPLQKKNLNQCFVK